jgi:hypothetical protein
MWESVMPKYVLYCMDGSRLVRCERFSTDSDALAIEESLRRQGDEAAELWCGIRKIAVLETRASSPAYGASLALG